MNLPDGDDVGEEDSEAEQISVPGSSKQQVYTMSLVEAEDEPT